MRRSPSRMFTGAALAAALAGAAYPASAQDAPVDFSQVTWPIVAITDSATIDFLLFELFLEPLEAPERLHVIDVTRNGFGPDDLILALPSTEVFLIPEFVPESVLERMGTWQPEVEYRMDSGNMPVQALAGLLGDDDQDKRAESAILYDVMEAVERSYHDLPMALLFQRDSVGFTFQLWDYNRGALAYRPRPELVPDSAVSEVLRVLEGVGYFPGQGVVGLGRSLESVGQSVASADQALLGVSRVADREARNLAVRTVLLGSYDLDRSGAIDTAREIDGPTCEVWAALDRSFPGYAEDLGFAGEGAPYLGALVLNIAANVRSPAYRRIAACRDGVEPPATDPVDVGPPDLSIELPEPVARFADSEVAADIVRRAAIEVQNGAAWAAEVRNILVARYDRDRSGRLERPSEVAAIPCVVWQVVVSTRPGGSRPDTGTAAQSTDWALLPSDLTALPADLEIGTAVHGMVINRVEGCLSSVEAYGAVRVPRARAGDTPVPSDQIRSMVTVPLEGLLRVPDEASRVLPAKTVLLAMFDTDRSGAVDRAYEIDAMPCSVWSALDTSFPDFARRFGFVRSAPPTPYRGDLLFSVAATLREHAEERILACERGEIPPRAAVASGDSPTRSVAVPEEVRAFLDLQTSAGIAQAAIDLRAGSAAWSVQVRATLLSRYDLDGSGVLEGQGELDEIPCGVWATLGATYPDLVETLMASDPQHFVASTIGIAYEQGPYARARLDLCQGR